MQTNRPKRESIRARSIPACTGEPRQNRPTKSGAERLELVATGHGHVTCARYGRPS